MSDQTESEIEVSADASYVINEDVVAEPVVETETIIADSVTPEDTALETSEEPVISDAAQKIIAEKAFAERATKRELEAVKKELEASRAKPEPAPVTEVARPDRWNYDSDDDYNRAVDGYANSVAEQRTAAAQRDNLHVQQRQAEYDSQVVQQKELQVKVESYVGRAKDLGVTPEALQVAGNRIAGYGLREDIASEIVGDPDGPLITTYLASNPQAIDALNGSTWMNGAEVYGKIKAQAGSLKPKTSKAPPPADISSGGAPSPEDNPWGATFT